MKKRVKCFLCKGTGKLSKEEFEWWMNWKKEAEEHIRELKEVFNI